MRTSILSIVYLTYFSNYNLSVKRYFTTFKREVHTVKPFSLDKLPLVSQSDCYFRSF
jgi:hypothetical protein